MIKNGADDKIPAVNKQPDPVLFVDHEITNGNCSVSGDNCHERRAEKHVVLSSFSSASTFGGKVAAEKNLGRCQGSSSLHGHLIGFDFVAVATPLCAR
jgi:hypothetical protein